jgi:hypothetical protein
MWLGWNDSRRSRSGPRPNFHRMSGATRALNQCGLVGQAVDQAAGVGEAGDAEVVAQVGEVLGVDGGAGGRREEQAADALGVLEGEANGERAAHRVAEQHGGAVELAEQQLAEAGVGVVDAGRAGEAAEAVGGGVGREHAADAGAQVGEHAGERGRAGAEAVEDDERRERVRAVRLVVGGGRRRTS